MAKDPLLLNDKLEKEIKRFFAAEIKGFCNISHFTIHVLLPTDKTIYISSSIDVSKHYRKSNLIPLDKSLDPGFYKKLPVYGWRCELNTETSNQINFLKEEVYKLYSGTNIVRKFDDIYVIYSIATDVKDPMMQYVFFSKVNQILELGDFAYNSFHSIFQENCGSYKLPKIKSFVPFTGGLDSQLVQNMVLNDSPQPVSNNEGLIENAQLKLIVNDNTPYNYNDVKHNQYVKKCIDGTNIVQLFK